MQVKGKAEKLGVHINWMGRRDHLDPVLQDYQVSQGVMVLGVQNAASLPVCCARPGASVAWPACAITNPRPQVGCLLSAAQGFDHVALCEGLTVVIGSVGITPSHCWSRCQPSKHASCIVLVPVCCQAL